MIWLAVLIVVVWVLSYYQVALLKSTVVLAALLSVYSLQSFNLLLW